MLGRGVLSFQATDGFLRSFSDVVTGWPLASLGAQPLPPHFPHPVAPPSVDTTHRPTALFLDAAGTFLEPSEAVSTVYQRYAKKNGVLAPPKHAILDRFREAYNEPWIRPLRYIGDARDFWRCIVFKSLGTTNEQLCEDIYEYYRHAGAWTAAPDLAESLARIRSAGVKTCVVSNFDNRLRPLLEEMQLRHLFDHIIVSAEVGAEKPSPLIFEAACRACGVDPQVQHVVHVGDDRRNDVWGARDAGLSSMMWGVDIDSFSELAERIEAGSTMM